MLNAEKLKQHLSYTESDGLFRWISPMSNRVKKGDIAGSNQSGYISIRILGKAYLAHRLAWYFVNGRWPENEIDHINGDRADNRIANLRECTRSQNRQNCAKRKGSISKYIGVSYNKNAKKWYARIKGPESRNKNLGYFKTEEEAYIAYCKAKPRYHKFNSTQRETNV